MRSNVLASTAKAIRVLKAVAIGVNAGLRKNAPRYLDIGARGGLPKRWQMVYRAGLIRPAFVEQDRLEASRLSKLYRDATMFPVALGAVDDELATLHITAHPAYASLRPPDATQPIVAGNPDYRVVDTVGMTLARFDTVWDRAAGPIEFIKIDVQGYELEVLKGCGSLLDDTVCIELEVTLKRLYTGQPLFQEVYEFLTNRGFDLVKLAPTSLFEFRQIIECNAYFVRHDAHDRPDVAMWKKVNDVGDQRRVVTWGY